MVCSRKEHLALSFPNSAETVAKLRSPVPAPGKIGSNFSRFRVAPALYFQVCVKIGRGSAFRRFSGLPKFFRRLVLDPILFSARGPLMHRNLLARRPIAGISRPCRAAAVLTLAALVCNSGSVVPGPWRDLVDRHARQLS